MPLRSKRSRVRVAPGPLRKLFPRFDFGRRGGFVFSPVLLRGNVRGNKPHLAEPILQRLEVLLDPILHDLRLRVTLLLPESELENFADRWRSEDGQKRMPTGIYWIPARVHA
jgi:hypothetical protein